MFTDFSLLPQKFQNFEVVFWDKSTDPPSESKVEIFSDSGVPSMDLCKQEAVNKYPHLSEKSHLIDVVTVKPLN